MKYFQQTRENGYSHWALWVFVFWITVLGWIAAQLFITSPILPITQEIDPVLANEFLKASTELVNEETAILLGFLFLGFIGSTLVGLILSIVALNQPVGRRRGLAISAGIFIFLSFATLLLMFPMMTSPESSRVLNKILAISPTVYALILLTFPATLVLLYVGQKHILKRSILSLHTAASRFRWFRVFQSILITWGIFAALAAVLHFTGVKPLTLTFDASRFFIYAAISLCLIPLQSATEEIVFRGYLNQAFENVLNNKWIAFVITSLMFMALHLSNPEALSGAESGILPIVMSSYFFFGFACCLMVWMDDGLESAIGVHAANNTFAAVFINYEGSVLPTPSIFQIQTLPVLDSLLTIVTLGLVLIALWYSRPKPVSPQV
jgi:membrane protease YdiL (CAAX protease family)